MSLSDINIIEEKVEGELEKSIKEEKKNREEIIKKLTNSILDSNPEFIDEFNNGKTNSIDEIIGKLKTKIDFDIENDLLRNIVGEEILSR